MKVSFGQCYIEPGVEFPFSHHFQRLLSDEVTALAASSAEFQAKYGNDYKLIFNVSAMQTIDDNEIRGPTVFKKTRDVEYTIFLPFDVIARDADAPIHALKFLLKGVRDVFGRLGIGTADLLKREDSLIREVCSNPSMLSARSWDQAQNATPITTIFETFFEKHRKM